LIDKRLSERPRGPYDRARCGPVRSGVALRGQVVQSSTQSLSLRIGTRGSPLALAQATTVRGLLAAAPGYPSNGSSRHHSHHRRRDPGPPAEVGGKGLFTKEIERRSSPHHRPAVRSAKDMPTCPDGS
jgi:hydroxymethylbilane synthase